MNILKPTPRRHILAAAVIAGFTGTLTACQMHAYADGGDVCREYLQDREIAETPEQQAAYDKCMKERTVKGLALKGLARRPPVTTWQCGAVILQYETISGPGWYRTTYRVINPDAISYDRSYGPPRYFVEWTGVDGRGEMLTLNGWPCQPARL